MAGILYDKLTLIALMAYGLWPMAEERTKATKGTKATGEEG